LDRALHPRAGRRTVRTLERSSRNRRPEPSNLPCRLECGCFQRRTFSVVSIASGKQSRRSFPLEIQD
jgi:hypothetical protein